MGGPEQKIDPRVRGERRKRLHCKHAIDALEREPERVLNIAVANVDLWEREQTCSPYYVETWRSLLAMPPDEIRNVVLADSDEARSLCSNNPFAGVFSMAEAREIAKIADTCDVPS